MLFIEHSGLGLELQFLAYVIVTIAIGNDEKGK